MKDFVVNVLEYHKLRREGSWLYLSGDVKLSVGYGFSMSTLLDMCDMMEISWEGIHGEYRFRV